MRSLKRFLARLLNSAMRRRDDEARRQALLKFGAAEAIRVRLHMSVRGIVLLLLPLIGVPGLGQKQQPPVDNAPSHASQTRRDTPRASSPTAIEEAPAKSGLPVPDLTPGPDGKLSQDQMQQLLRVVADKDIENDKRQRDYTYIEREVKSKLDGNGKTKSTEVRTYEILEIYGEQVQKLIAKDDKPLSAKEAAKEDEKIQKIIDKRKNESEVNRKKREEKELKDREEERAFVREVADAYNFKLVGAEGVAGRNAWVIEGEPRPGFHPRMKDAKYLPKFHGRVWIDKDDLQLAKMDVECLDTIWWGGFLVRFHKGSRFVLEQTRVNDEVWLPRRLGINVDVRLALLKDFNVDIQQTFRDYKKFRTETKIVGIGEMHLLLR